MLILRTRQKGHLLLRAVALGVLGLIAVATSRAASAQTQSGTPQEAVAKFCALDFSGAQDVEKRQSLIDLSEGRVRELGKRMGGMSPYVFEWETAPLSVVDSYKVGQITVSGDQATASVTYQVVAQRGVWGGRLTRKPDVAMLTELKLRRYGDTWKVIDPPPPNVSRAFLSSSYRSIFELPQSWYQNASPAQLMRLRDAIDTILFLDGLK